MSRFRLRDDGVDWRALQGRIVALDLEGSRYLSITESGAALWEMLATGTTREALVEALVARHGITPERAAGDIDAFLSQLEARELIVSEAD